MKEHTPVEQATAVKRYETKLLARGREPVLASQENTSSIHDWNTMMQSPFFTFRLAMVVKEPNYDERKCNKAVTS